MVPDNKIPKKDIFILIIILILVIAAGAFLYLRATNSNINIIPGGSEQVTPTVSLIPTGDLPHYQLADSPLAFPALIAAARVWAADTKFVTCSGTGTIYTQDGNKYYLGFDKGAFYKWVCVIYSPDKHQDTLVEWQGGRATVSSPIMTYTGALNEANPNTRAYYELDKFVSSQLAYQTVLANGFNDTADYQDLSLGQSAAQQLFETAPVWEVHEYSRTIPNIPDDPSSEGKLTKTYFIEGTTGVLLQTDNN
jgi:hypothetical protein